MCFRNDNAFLQRFSLKVFLILVKIFKCFFKTYMGMVAILFNGVEPFEQYALDRRLHVKSGENWSSGF